MATLFVLLHTCLLVEQSGRVSLVLGNSEEGLSPLLSHLSALSVTGDCVAYTL